MMISRNTIYIAVAALLVTGLVVTVLLGNQAGWFGRDAAENGFELAKPQLEQQLRQAKEQELIVQHVQDLREAADVETNLDIVGKGEENAVVAMVNGEEITEKTLLEIEEHEKQELMMRGVDPDSEEAQQIMLEMRPQILDNLIANILLEQQAAEAGISISDEEVEELYQLYADQSGGEEMLAEQLEQFGMSTDELRQEIAKQLAIETYVDNYIAANLDDEALEFSDAELRELYERQQLELQQPAMPMPME